MCLTKNNRLKHDIMSCGHLPRLFSNSSEISHIARQIMHTYYTNSKSCRPIKLHFGPSLIIYLADGRGRGWCGSLMLCQQCFCCPQARPCLSFISTLSPLSHDPTVSSSSSSSSHSPTFYARRHAVQKKPLKLVLILNLV